MRTKFYEDNGGGIHAIVKDGQGNVINVLTGFQHEQDCDLAELLQAARDGFPDAYPYDPDQFSGLDIYDAADAILKTDVLVADITQERAILYTEDMGAAACGLFKVEEEVKA